MNAVPAQGLGAAGDDVKPGEAGITSELAEIGERVGEVVEALLQHPDEDLRTRVEEVLAGIDRLHREALRRLAGLLVHHQLFEHACADPVVAMVFELYELWPLPASEAEAGSPEPLASAAGREPGGLGTAQRTTGVPFEEGRAEGGVVGHRPEATKPVRPTSTSEASKASRPAGFIPLSGIVRIPASPESGQEGRSPERVDVAPAADIAEQQTMVVSADGRILVCNVDGTLHALRNRCGRSPLPLHLGTLTGTRLVCPWHEDCVYDVTTGESTSGRRTAVYPVSVEDGMVCVSVADRRGPDLSALRGEEREQV